jgi:arylsulfatase
MNKRTPTLILSTLLAVVSPIAAQTAATRAPDIVVIMADDLGFSDIGCYGGEIRTPNLDSLAANGLRFSQFYNAARCCPTRASLLTGLHPHQAGIGGMVSPGKTPAYLGRLNESCVTLGEVLKTAGYHTAVSGKWHVTHFDYSEKPLFHRESWPRQRGFDRFFGTLAGGGNFYDPVSLMRDNEFIKPWQDFYYTHAINREAAAFISEAPEDKPLFLYVAHTAPHWPLHALEEDIKRYDGVYYDIGWDSIRERRHRRLVDEGLIPANLELSPRSPKVPSWKNAKNKKWQARRMAVHAAMVDSMDQGIGRLIEALKERGSFDNTLILFLSDNGGSDEVINGQKTRHGNFARGGTTPDVMPGPPDTYASIGEPWANVSNTPFRLYKKWTHEGGIASPLVVHWPQGITDKGGVRHQVGHVIDIMATVVDLAGAEYPARHKGHDITPMEGISLRPAFADKPLVREAMYWEHFGQRAVRMGSWKLVGSGGRWELYDMENDRTETRNLSAQHPDRVKHMAAMWEAWAERCGADQ